MTNEVVVEVLQASQWMRARELRIRALTESPSAFGSTVERETTLAEEAWRARLTSNLWVVAIVDGVDVGLAAGITLDGGAPELTGMWVDPGSRRTGVSTLLIDRVAEWARGLGAPTLYLHVVESNAAAIAAYERNGFELVDGAEHGQRRMAKPL